jgi:putative membrane protein
MIKSSEKLVFRIVLGISIFVFLLVVLLNKRIFPVPQEIPSFAYFLPKLNAIINGTCFVLLILTLYFVKKKRFDVHKRINITAFFLSALFLISYVIYHYLVPETTFGGTGSAKSIYYFILITHIILAAIVLPLVLLSFYYGLEDNRAKHRKIVRWSYPIWLYVTFTGVLVYLLLSPYYNFPI